MTSIAKLVFDRIQEVPEHTAIWARGVSLTYRAFGDRALELATLLRGHGVRRGDCVAILSQRSSTLYCSILGTIAAGATYVALNPRYPPARNRLILSESEAKVLIIDDKSLLAATDLLADLPALELVVTPESDSAIAFAGKPVKGKSALLIGVDAFDPDLGVPGSDLMYVIFTSGSTGKPKGVQITHDNLHAYLDNVARHICPTTPDDRVIQISDVTFDVSIHDMFTAWANGAAMISIPENSALMSARFVQEHGITQWFSVPSTARLLHQSNQLDPGSLPTLRSSIFAGEPLVCSVASAWMRAAPHSPVYNLYGPTEGTISLSLRRFDPADFEPHEVVSLGEPFPDNKMAIVDPVTNATLPHGTIGEIAFAGSQVTQGYWRDPALNATRFFKSAKGEHWYKTGDLGRYDAKRGFVFAGRVDHQVKIRGFRVELGEIEGVIRAAAKVTEAAVLPWPLSSDGNPLGCVAFVPKSPAGLDEKAVIDACASKLPDYMVPSRIIAIPELPLNVNGKIDYKALAQRSELTV